MKANAKLILVGHVLVLLLLAATFAPVVQGQTFELLHSFQYSTDGADPFAGLVQGSDGNFYGTSKGDTTISAFGVGTVFKITTSGVFTTLAAFSTNVGSYGCYPMAALVQGADGNFYGTTEYSANHYGTVFKVTPNGMLTTLVSFNQTNGANPYYGPLIQARDGNFYGTTEFGGTSSKGTVFKMTTNGALTTLVSFQGTNGANPYAGLVQASDGNFYGTTVYGGTNGDWGTVFKMTTNGALTTLVSFNVNTNGGRPYAGLVQGRDGNLYGTTSAGGANGDYGTAFRITTNGVFATLVSFGAANGSNPQGTLMQGRDGNLYGTTVNGGTNSGNGTAFRMTPDGALTSLVSFSGPNGAFPIAGLVQGSDGSLYGTTYQYPFVAGAHYGTIFRLVFPVLDGRRSGNDKFILSWPSNAISFTLQSTISLTPPIAWTVSTNVPVIVGTNLTVTNALTSGAQFYRLSQ